MPRRKPTVVIVGDHSATAQLWRRKLTNAGFKVVGNFSSLSPSGGEGRGEVAFRAQTTR